MKGSFTNLDIGDESNYIIDCLSLSKPLYLFSNGELIEYDTDTRVPVSRFMVYNLNVYYNSYGVHAILEYDDKVLVTGSYSLLSKGFLQAYMLAENTITVFREFEGWDKLPLIQSHGKVYKQVTNELIGEGKRVNKVAYMFNKSFVGTYEGGYLIEGLSNLNVPEYPSLTLDDVSVLTWRGPYVEGSYLKCLDQDIPTEEIRNAITKVGDAFCKDGVLVEVITIPTGLQFKVHYKSRTFTTDIAATSVLYAKNVYLGKE